MTAAPPTVPCATCGRRLETTHEQLRELDGRLVPCPWCAAKRAAPKAVPAVADRTAADWIVLAAAHLESLGGTRDGIGLSDLIIEAWRSNRAKFGLKGHEWVYPSSKRVECELSKMLRPNNARPALLALVGPCRYRLTPAGAARAAALEGRTK